MATTASVVNALAPLPGLEDPHVPTRCSSRSSDSWPSCPGRAYSYKQAIGSRSSTRQLARPDRELPPHDVSRCCLGGQYEVTPTIVHRAQADLILHADHEQNCSTSTVRMVGSAEATSTRRSPAVSTHCGALCTAAPSSGRGDARNHPRRRRRRERGGERAKDPHDPFRLSGIRSPRVQELRPRAKILKGTPSAY